jgi:hypothetical protein
MVNNFFGGLVIAPEGEFLQDELVEAIYGLQNDLPNIQKGIQKVESLFDKWRSSMNYKARSK